MIKNCFYLVAFILLPFFSLAQNKVKTHEGVEIGGIKQWIGAKSNDDSKPLLLFMHGGPGFTSRAYSKKFVKHLKNDFILAQWDQRGTGITSAWNPSSDTLSIEMMHDDLEEVVDYLLRKFKKKKLYLVGFSWGGFLGFEFAINHPELLHAYIPVSSAVYGIESERRTLEMIKDKSQDSQNDEALEELSLVEIPFQSWEQLYYQRKWTAHFSGSGTKSSAYPRSLFESWSNQWMDIFLEASEVDYRKKAAKLECPVYFFISDKDLVSNYQLAEEYFNQLEAKQKKLVWFYESTHEIPSEEAKKFSQELILVKNDIRSHE